jgi:hypothetical protein
MPIFFLAMVQDWWKILVRDFPIFFSIFFKRLHTENLHEIQDILVSSFSGWLRARMAG